MVRRHRARCSVSYHPAGLPATPAYRLLGSCMSFPFGTPRSPSWHAHDAIFLQLWFCKVLFLSFRLVLFPGDGIERGIYRELHGRVRQLEPGPAFLPCESFCPLPPRGPRQRTSGLRRDSDHRRRPPAAPRRYFRAPSCAHHAWASAIHPASSYTHTVSRRLVLSRTLAFRSLPSSHAFRFQPSVVR